MSPIKNLEVYFVLVYLGMGVRVFGSGSYRFLSGPGLSDLKHLDPIGTYKFSVWIRVGSFRVQVGSVYN